MGDRRVDLIQRSFEAFDGLDADAAIPLYVPDCVWDVGRDIGTVFGQQRYEGHEGLRELMARIGEVFPDWSPTINEIREAEGGELLLRGVGAGHSKLSGMGLEMPEYGQVIRYRDDLILSIELTESPPPGWDDAKPID